MGNGGKSQRLQHGGTERETSLSARICRGTSPARAGRFALVPAPAVGFPPFTAMPPLIRPATPADLPLILTLIRDLAAYEKLLPEVTATEAGLGATLFGPRPAAECVLAFAADGTPAGFAVFFTNYSTFLAQPGLWLEDLFVRPEHRDRGIGRALLLHLAQLANARGCGRMEWAVLDWNQPAIDFYEALGARRLRDWQICRLTGEALARHA
jgi:GNAT superfamily N-acetyltransferase